ncbi:hypothetical protein BWI97_18310 [Siphonobacter sp. BAB-5405]|uniref:hypothetical protein n=1 Tax=Siphonobacter sp. BAB-5405 TaxID=1864825 RepID=UPI000C808A5B|nr:hypothetical protein [Siphonobacter sp. BAB-5405]PMD93546.1 hypothetical protein BWI97_18310 [Siphonobacter sp. BAB-5405]
MAKIQFIPRGSSFSYYPAQQPSDDDDSAGGGWLFIIGFLLLLYGIWAYLKLSKPEEETPVAGEPLLPTLPELSALLEIKPASLKPEEPVKQETPTQTPNDDDSAKR